MILPSLVMFVNTLASDFPNSVTHLVKFPGNHPIIGIPIDNGGKSCYDTCREGGNAGEKTWLQGRK